MTNVTANCITATSSYDKYGAILEYLRECVNFDYSVYNQKGIRYLIELLQKKYANVDIDYIVCTLDTMNQSEKTGNYIYLDKSKDLLDEIFEICKIELEHTTENYYEPFAKFAKILYYTENVRKQDSDILYAYLEKYNEFLKKKGCHQNIITKEDVINKAGIYEDVKQFATKENNVFPVVDNDIEGNTIRQTLSAT